MIQIMTLKIGKYKRSLLQNNKPEGYQEMTIQIMELLNSKTFSIFKESLDIFIFNLLLMQNENEELHMYGGLKRI